MNTKIYSGVVDFIRLRLITKYKVSFINIGHTSLSVHLPVYCDLIEPPTVYGPGDYDYLI